MTLEEAIQKFENLVSDAQVELDPEAFTILVGFIWGSGSRLVEAELQ